MRHIRRLKCSIDGYEPSPGETVCPVHGGRDDWIWHCDRHGRRAIEGKGCELCGYAFQGRRLFDKADVGKALLSQWDEAVKHVRTMPLERWVAESLDDGELAERLRAYGLQSVRFPNAALAAAIAILLPQGGVKWCGRLITREHLTTRGAPSVFEGIASVAELLGGPLPDWTRHLPEYRWLGEIQAQCHARAHGIGLQDLAVATGEHWWWLLADSASVMAIVRRRRDSYAGVEDGSLGEIFWKEELSEMEAFSLAVADTSKFLTPTAAWGKLVDRSVAAFEKLREQAAHRPSSQRDLERVREDFEGCVMVLRNQREQMRGRIPVDEPKELFRSREAVRATLRQGFKSFDRAHASLEEMRGLIARGHAGLAVRRVAEISPAVSQFYDLDISFISAAKSRLERTRRRIFLISGLVVGATLCGALIFKLMVNPQ